MKRTIKFDEKLALDFYNCINKWYVLSKRDLERGEIGDAAFFAGYFKSKVNTLRLFGVDVLVMFYSTEMKNGQFIVKNANIGRDYFVWDGEYRSDILFDALMKLVGKKKSHITLEKTKGE